MTFTDGLRVTLSIVVYAGMIALCVLWRDHGGLGGLIGGGIGFLIRYLEGGQWTHDERLGNGYAGSLIGLPFGFLLGAGVFYVAAHWREWSAALGVN